MTEATDILSPEKQLQILRGAATVFSQDGYEGASMSRIAACAGVSKGTLYNYFESKADLFAAWVAGECARKLAGIFNDTDPDGEPDEVLRGIGLRMLTMMMSESGLTIYRVTVSEAAKFPELAKIFYESGPSRATASLASWLRRQTVVGRLMIPDPVFAAEQFFAMCQTRVGMLRRLGLLTVLDEAEADRIVDAAVQMFLNYYGAIR